MALWSPTCRWTKHCSLMSQSFIDRFGTPIIGVFSYCFIQKEKDDKILGVKSTRSFVVLWSLEWERTTLETRETVGSWYRDTIRWARDVRSSHQWWLPLSWGALAVREFSVMRRRRKGACSICTLTVSLLGPQESRLTLTRTRLLFIQSSTWLG